MDDGFDPVDASWSRVSPKLAVARRAVLIVSAAVLAVAVALVALLADEPRIAGAAVVAAALISAVGWRWIGRNQRAWRYTERDDDLLVRRGIAFRQLLVVPYGRMQFVEVKDGPLQRRLGIATVQLHTAAATTDAQIPGLPTAEAARLRDRLAARGESRTAGL